MHSQRNKIAIIGLGYVGLPLAVSFGEKHLTVGFDIDDDRINELRNNYDRTREITKEEFVSASKLTFTGRVDAIRDCKYYIVTVPTPIDEFKKPSFEALIEASKIIGKVISKGAIIIYESTVFPGATEEICVPVLEKQSHLKFNEDFFCGYSPERINPGDSTHRLADIKKITAGSTLDTAKEVDQLYGTIIKAGTYRVSSIKVAEAAKVIENTQRDINIALINELSLIFRRLGIDTEEVLLAAETKWNFSSYRPGLVGGHCIGVDPYYLTHKAIEVGYRPEMILAGRQLNEDMAANIVDHIRSLMTERSLEIKEASTLIMGLAFKENCPDIRNSGVFKLINELDCQLGNTDVYDPWVNKEEAKRHNVMLLDKPKVNSYDLIILAVAHDHFLKLGVDSIRTYGKINHLLYDIKYLFSPSQTDGRT